MMSHCHHHGHHSSNGSTFKPLAIVLLLTSLYMVIEFLGGLWTHSLALLADAGHMLTDVAGVGLALFAAWFANHPPPPEKTYGYYRLEILAAFINGLALVAIAIGISYEALQRFSHPTDIKGLEMIWIATGGLIINLIAAWLLHQGKDSNINMKGAYLHVLSDSLGSLGAIIAGILVLNFSFTKADPIISLVIALLILYNAGRLLIEATNILLEACPTHLNVSDIHDTLLGMPGIESVHDLHVWSITSGKDALSVHVTVTDDTHFKPELITHIQHEIKEKFGLSHLTIQLEPPGFEEDEIHF